MIAKFDLGLLGFSSTRVGLSSESKFSTPYSEGFETLYVKIVAPFFFILLDSLFKNDFIEKKGSYFFLSILFGLLILEQSFSVVFISSGVLFLFLLTFLSLSTFAQEKKYQSLFWEISGNGLTKKSYMYGTMHVSDKVSFHLSDSFFEKLMASDFIANESEPNTWTELYDLYGFYQSTQTRRNFYANFY